MTAFMLFNNEVTFNFKKNMVLLNFNSAIINTMFQISEIIFDLTFSLQEKKK